MLSDVKLFSLFHNPKGNKYVIYYTVILVMASGSVVFATVQPFALPVLDRGAIFFEGFLSMFMLARHEKTGTAFMAHLRKFGLFESS
jgi:hypothetical protein